MKFSNALKRKFSTVIWITVSWALISMVQLGYEITILKEYGFEYRWSNPDDIMPYIFDAFEKSRDGKFGIGLSIVKRTCTLFGYDVAAQNTDNGVCFIISNTHD